MFIEINIFQNYFANKKYSFQYSAVILEKSNNFDSENISPTWTNF